ncbi:hypothetical protein BDB01DRAFT_840989 [Pilobolus umbonatus]|nr:hypothetical protein BDB01DRAFT_840989 [Pilobolus umbonatus]
MAAEKGDSGAEAIALEIGSYMGECIEIIEEFGGDVVKFLGDAVLVCFQPIPFDTNDGTTDTTTEDSIKRKKDLITRAVDCGLQLLAKQSHYRVYLTAEERSKYRSSAVDDKKVNPQRFVIFDGETSSVNSRGSFSDGSTTSLGNDFDHRYFKKYSIAFSLWDFIPVIFGKSRKNKVYATRRVSDTSDTTTERNAIDLELHIALSCGDITNVVLGDIKPSKHSTHYSRSSYSPSPVSPIHRRSTRNKRCSYMSVNDNDSGNQVLEYQGRLEYAICGPAVESLEDALTNANAGEISITPEVYSLYQQDNPILRCEKRKQFYILKSSLVKPSHRKNSRFANHLHHHHSQKTLIPSHHLLCDHVNATTSTLNTESIISHSRNSSVIELPVDKNSNYLKYINRSALYQLQHSTDENLMPQFRDVTIMFISLGKLNVAIESGLKIAQKAVYTTIQTLVKYEGVLQQFAIDDKGATLLAVFGLPPLSHEREAIFAAKAAIDIRDSLLTFVEGFSISLSTGTIFNAVLPQKSPYRRDPAIAGDTIVLAVRMLKFPFSKKSIVCDFATKQQIGRSCDFADYGENFVKGKIKPIQIYGILRFDANKIERIASQDQDVTSNIIGYRVEMETATDFVDEWNDSQNHHLLIVSGASGAGKSFFCKALSKVISTDTTICCWTSSTEVEKSSKYYLVKNILLGLFDIIESRQLPVNTRRRHLFPNGSGGLHMNGSINSYHMDDCSSNSSVISIVPSATTTKENHTSNCINGLPAITTFSSLSRMSNTANYDPLTDSANELISLIGRCLRVCGEDEGFLPLFKVVFTSLANLKDNKYIRRVDSRGRDILLTGVITRMIRYVSEHVGLVFISDDVQWADSSSIRLLQHIHEHCQRVLLILATRPVQDYKVTFIDTFRETGYFEEISLNGLSSPEIKEILLQTFASANVETVSPEVLRVVQKKTAGNPLYIKNMAIVLKDLHHIEVVEGVLVPTNTRFDLEHQLMNLDYKRIIKTQFDRLNSGFQEFLTVASCLDQTFTIKEVQSVLKESNTEFKYVTEETVQQKVEAYDVYKFLKKEADSILAQNKIIYTFAHISIPQCIYDMVSYEIRIALHRSLATFYEDSLRKENYAELLGKITRHYLQTDRVAKQLYFLRALAELNMKSYLLPEATINLEKAVKIIDENQELAVLYGRLRKCDIYRQLGMCFTMRTKLEEGERYLFLALDCLGEPWPRSEPEFLYKFWINRFTQYKHRKLPIFRRLNKDYKEIETRVVEIMALLSNIYFFTGKGRDFVYSCLVGLNACERLGEVNPNYTLFLARNSLLCWLNDDKQQSIFYITKALRYIDEKNDFDTLSIYAHLYFAAGRFKNASELLYKSIDAVRTLGVVTDCQAFYRSVGLLITMRIFEGSLDSSPNDLLLLKQMADTAHANCDFEAEIWLAVYNIGNALIMDKLRECEAFVTLLETNLKQSADYNRIAIHGTLLYYYARMHNYTSAQRHLMLLVSILPLLTVTPNIFPIFGLIFGTMGMYYMLEDDQVAFVCVGDRKRYNRFIHGVFKINHAFQQVKFWEFTQPCLYLARALPYISTGRTVEGFTVLQHGAHAMHLTQEIKFLKAFYWANLGKYAFTPSDRIAWTENARKDLDDLNIPAHVYCNPDPVTMYSRDTPADLIA